MLNNKLKAFLLGTLFVAIVSLVVMFYYSVEFTKYSQIGVKYVEMLKTDFLTNGWTRGTSGEKFGNATSARSNASRHIYVRETQSLVGKKLRDFVDVIRGVGSSKEGSTQTPKTETVGKREEVNKTIPTPASNEQTTEEAKELPLCSGGSKQGKRFKSVTLTITTTKAAFWMRLIWFSLSVCDQKDQILTSGLRN